MVRGIHQGMQILTKFFWHPVNPKCELLNLQHQILWKGGKTGGSAEGKITT